MVAAAGHGRFLMQPLLLFLAVSAFIGLRSHRADSPISRQVLLGASLLLAVALYSRRLL